MTLLHRRRVQVTVQVGSMTIKLAAQDLEPLQGGQRGRQLGSSKRQQRAQPNNRGKDSRRQEDQRQQQQQQQEQSQGGAATIQTAANTVDVRGQRALEVRRILLPCARSGFCLGLH